MKLLDLYKEIREDKPRSLAQNRAFHLYFKEMAEMLNESGLSVQLFLQDFEVDYSKEMVKGIWRTIGKKKFGKDSSASWTNTEVQSIYEEFNRQVSKHGFHIPFPSNTGNFDEDFLRENGII